MMMQAQALQRGEKFKESEVRGRTHATVHTTDERVLESAQGAQHVLTVLPPPKPHGRAVHFNAVLVEGKCEVVVSCGPRASFLALLVSSTFRAVFSTVPRGFGHPMGTPSLTSPVKRKPRGFVDGAAPPSTPCP